MTTTSDPAQASLRPTLKGAYYTDPAVFAREQEHVFEQMWVGAVRSADLARPGAFRTVQVGRESVVVVRGRDGVLRAFLNVCRHRGAMLCTEPAGEVRRTLQCPYHAWTYDLDGTLVGRAEPHQDARRRPGRVRPARGAPARVARLRLGVPGRRARRRSSRTCSARSSSGSATWSRSSATRRRTSRWAGGSRTTWRPTGSSSSRTSWSATTARRSTPSSPSCCRSSPTATRRSTTSATARSSPRTRRGSPSTAPRASTGCPGVVPDQDRRYFAVTIAPTTFINLVPDHVIVLRMFPVAADRTVVECDWLYSKDVVAAGKDVSRSVELFDRVNRQDFAACERTPAGDVVAGVPGRRRARAGGAPHRGVPRLAGGADRLRGRSGGAGEARHAPGLGLRPLMALPRAGPPRRGCRCTQLTLLRGCGADPAIGVRVGACRGHQVPGGPVHVRQGRLSVHS